MVQKVFGEIRFVVGIFISAEVFAESDEERILRSVQHMLSCNRDMSVCRYLIFRICLVGCGCVWEVVC
jgi:hypothetical protein